MNTPFTRTARPVAQAVAILAALLLAAALLAACSSSPTVQLYQLRADPPATALALPAAPASTAGGRWALGPVTLPEVLDRDALLVPTGQAGLTALPGQRWAEPLRDAVPRLLLQDLARLRGADNIWRSPAPAGVKTERLLRVSVQQFNARADGQAVLLQARWELLDPSGQAPAAVFESRIEALVTAASTDALVAAHRDALWQLARDIATRGQVR